MIKYHRGRDHTRPKGSRKCVRMAGELRQLKCTTRGTGQEKQGQACSTGDSSQRIDDHKITKYKWLCEKASIKCPEWDLHQTTVVISSLGALFKESLKELVSKLERHPVSPHRSKYSRLQRYSIGCDCTEEGYLYGKAIVNQAAKGDNDNPPSDDGDGRNQSKPSSSSSS
jgi:hypothetical protein